MKEEGYAFEIGYYYAVGLVIFAIVIFYSVHFPPVCFAGLLCFNCKVNIQAFLECLGVLTTFESLAMQNCLRPVSRQ